MTSKSGSSSAGETPTDGCPPRARELLPTHHIAPNRHDHPGDQDGNRRRCEHHHKRRRCGAHFLGNLAIRRRVDPSQRPQPRATVVGRRPRRPAAGRFGLCVSSPRSPKAAGHVRRHLPHTRVAMMKFSAQFRNLAALPRLERHGMCSLHTHFRATTAFGEADAASARPAHNTKWRIN
jgi:hypothetical protein